MHTYMDTDMHIYTVIVRLHNNLNLDKTRINFLIKFRQQQIVLSYLTH